MNNKIIASHCYGANKEVIGKNGIIYKSKSPKKLGIYMNESLKSKKPKISQSLLYKKFNAYNVIGKFSKEILEKL